MAIYIRSSYINDMDVMDVIDVMYHENEINEIDYPEGETNNIYMFNIQNNMYINNEDNDEEEDNEENYDEEYDNPYIFINNTLNDVNTIILNNEKIIDKKYVDKYVKTQENDEDICAICHENFEENCKIFTDKNGCNGIFHLTCIEKWFSRNKSCPKCRHVID
jgi:hypothetical protein